MKKPALEIEIKLAISNAATMRRKLRSLGFRVSTPRVFERNLVWDTPRGALKRQGLLLRLRVTGQRTLVTLKGPRRRQRGFRVRPEWEMNVSNTETADAILRALGYRPVFRYEKYRTVFCETREQSRTDKKGKVLLDETPIGDYLELEGDPAWIRRVARQLGFTPADFITESYGDLHRAWHRRNKRRSIHMIFHR